MPEINDEPWRPYLPDYVSLYYVDYQDNLHDSRDGMKLIAQCLKKNNLYPLSENIYDWWDYPEGPYIEEIQKNMAADEIEWDDDWIEEIREALWDKDESTPIDDLLRNTGDIAMYYDLCDEYGDAWCMTSDEIDDDVAAICGTLNIPLSDEKRVQLVRDVLVNCGGVGGLRIYFNCPLKDAISGDEYAEDKKDFKTIKFKGNYTVSIHNPIEGGGWSEEIELDCEFEFNRANLQLADYGDRYTWRSVYGCDPEGDAPIFSMDESESAKVVVESQANAAAEREEEYDRVFKAGGCTFGDMKYTRHRDVYYRNDYPCGDICPHCGTFWID